MLEHGRGGVARPRAGQGDLVVVDVVTAEEHGAAVLLGAHDHVRRLVVHQLAQSSDRGDLGVAVDLHVLDVVRSGLHHTLQVGGLDFMRVQ